MTDRVIYEVDLGSWQNIIKVYRVSGYIFGVFYSFGLAVRGLRHTSNGYNELITFSMSEQQAKKVAMKKGNLKITESMARRGGILGPSFGVPVAPVGIRGPGGPEMMGPIDGGYGEAAKRIGGI